MSDQKTKNLDSILNRIEIPKIYAETEINRFSVIVYGISCLVVLLRKVSIYANLQKMIYSEGKTVPAVFLELYLMVYWIASITLLYFLPRYSEFLAIIVIAASIVQVVQANLYHEFLRPEYLANKGESTDVAHSRLRSFVIGVLNYCFVTTLFGFAYWIWADDFGEPKIGGLGNCIYFSFTYAWSAGSRSVAPNDISSWLQIVIVLQILTTLFLVAALLSITVSGLRSVGAKERAKAAPEVPNG